MTVQICIFHFLYVLCIFCVCVCGPFKFRINLSYKSWQIIIRKHCSFFKSLFDYVLQFLNVMNGFWAKEIDKIKWSSVFSRRKFAWPIFFLPRHWSFLWFWPLKMKWDNFIEFSFEYLKICHKFVIMP